MPKMKCPKCGSEDVAFSPRTGRLVCFNPECNYDE